MTDLFVPSIFSASGGIAEALRSVARADAWSLQRVFLQTASLLSAEEQKPVFTPPDSPVLVCKREDKQ